MSLNMAEGKNKHNDSKNSRKRKKARRGSKSNNKHQGCSTDNGKPCHGSSATIEEKSTIDSVNEEFSSHEAVGKAHEQVDTPVTAGGATTKIATAISSGSGSSINSPSKKSKKRRRQERAASSSGAIGTNLQPTDKKTDSGSACDTNRRTTTAVHQKEVDTRSGVGKCNRAGDRAGIDSSDNAVKAPAPRLSDLQKRMRQKLEGAQFRMINETLYTSESGASLAKFKGEPGLFDVVSIYTMIVYGCFVSQYDYNFYCTTVKSRRQSFRALIVSLLIITLLIVAGVSGCAPLGYAKRWGLV